MLSASCETPSRLVTEVSDNTRSRDWQQCPVSGQKSTAMSPCRADSSLAPAFLWNRRSDRHNKCGADSQQLHRCTTNSLNNRKRSLQSKTNFRPDGPHMPRAARLAFPYPRGAVTPVAGNHDIRVGRHARRQERKTTNYPNSAVGLQIPENTRTPAQPSRAFSCQY